MLVGGLVAVLFFASFAAKSLTGAIIEDAELSSPFVTGYLPGWFQLLLLSACVAAAAILLRGSLQSFRLGGLKSSLRLSVAWVMAGALIWMSILFFSGWLTELNRLFVLVAICVLIPATVLFRLILDLRFVWYAVVAIASALLLIWLVLGFPVLPSFSILRQPAAFIEALVAWPGIVAVAFTVCAGLSWIAANRRYPSDTLYASLVKLAILILGSHLGTLLLLFVAGYAGIPRWLPVATAALMTLSGFAVLLGSALLRRGGLRRQTLSEACPSGSYAELVLSAKPTPALRRAWIISYTGVSNEPRVLRQAEALMAEGWDVVVCGYDGHSARPEAWNFVRLPSSDVALGPWARVLALLQRGLRIIAAYGRPAGFFEWAGRAVHLLTPTWFLTRSELVRLAKEHPELKADLVIAHDYHSADAGYAVARVYGSKFSVDVHEYAAGQYFNDPAWVKWQRPIAVAVQRHYLNLADIVTVVCQSIADLIAAENGLKREPVTIRSVPFKNVQQFRTVGERIKVLYHGDLSVRREIHTLIESMRFWRDDADLTLRGSGDPAYIADLKRQIARLNLASRVTFEAAVPFDEIVPSANKADIGYFSFKGDSPQIRFTLPNKFFEYVMAGLCLCVGDTDEVGKIVRQYNVGSLIPAHDPRSIADAINALSRSDIEQYKKASLVAAEELNWESEKVRLLAAYEAALRA